MNAFSQAASSFLKIVGIVIVVLVAISLLISLVEWIKSRIKTVKEGEKAVIFRRGKFNRLAGPGWVFLWPGETIDHKLEVRDRPKSYSVDQLFFYGIPVGFMFSFWSRVDPEEAANGDKALLRNMAVFNDNERDQQVLLKIRDSFMVRVAELERRRALPEDANIIERILPILPGTPDCDRLLSNVRDDLQGTLQFVGVFLNSDHPLTVTGLIAPTEMIQGFSRGRMIELLRRSYPRLGEDRLSQMAAAIEGLTTIKTTTIDLKGSESQTMAEVKVGDEDDRTKLKIFPPQPPQSAAERRQPQTTAEQQTASAHVDGQIKVHAVEKLSDHDLRYLKRVPRQQRDERSAA